jgi:DNA-3-methyladenine glycosylase II
MNKNYFTYQIVPIEQTTELLNIEPKLGEFIDFTKPFNIRIMPDHFQCLIHCIISQQISSAALDTIWHKLIMYFKKITPKTIARATNEQLNAIGIASQKISPIKQIAYDIVDKKLNLDKLEKLSDAEITAILTKYKYVGQ